MLEYRQGARRMSKVPAYAWKLYHRLVIIIHIYLTKIMEKSLHFSIPEREARCNSCGNESPCEEVWTTGTVATLFCRILTATSLRDSYGPAWMQSSICMSLETKISGCHNSAPEIKKDNADSDYPQGLNTYVFPKSKCETFHMKYLLHIWIQTKWSTTFSRFFER